MENNFEQFEEETKDVKKRKTANFTHLLTILSNYPKTEIPLFDSDRVKNQILDRISIPAETTAEKSGFGRFALFAPYLRIGVGVMATLLIVVSLTLGTAVAALTSVPGSAIYPLKKVVESIQLKLTPEDQKATLQIKFAGNRAEELQQVLEKNQEGKISDQEAQAIVVNTIKDLQKTASAAAKSKPKSNTIVNKLADINSKLKAASIESEGVVKIELEKALEANQNTQEEAIKNLERAGLKVEDAPLSIDNSIKASGKLTATSDTAVSIGTVKFLLTKDTKLDGLELKDLKAGIVVDIVGEIKDNKAYATKITLTKEVKIESVDTTATDDSQNAQ